MSGEKRPILHYGKASRPNGNRRVSNGAILTAFASWLIFMVLVVIFGPFFWDSSRITDIVLGAALLAIIAASAQIGSRPK